MHEMGIVMHLAKTLDELAEEQNIAKIGSVTLQVGEVSGIMTDLFTDAWDYFKVRHPVLSDSQLKLETIKAYTFCAAFQNCRIISFANIAFDHRSFSFIFFHRL